MLPRLLITITLCLVVYDKYEAFLEEREMTKGEVDVAIIVIKESYAQHMKEHTLLKDIRGYSSKN